MTNEQKREIRKEWLDWLWREDVNGITLALPNGDDVADWWIPKIDKAVKEKEIEILKKECERLEGEKIGEWAQQIDGEMAKGIALGRDRVLQSVIDYYQELIKKIEV